ncbi:MAG: hypothetical protein IPM98_15655, partial [Lewinellaceae bacterium]|nr:hypothetical protein [Lewinellaceae bacterium]
AQTAHDNASPGDTLHIEPSVTTYGNLTMTKRLTLIGNGYFLQDNMGLQVNTNTSQFAVITCDAGSKRSKITGMVLTTGIAVNTDSITIERNYFATNTPAQSSNYGVAINGNVTGIYVTQNYMYPMIYSVGGAASYVYIMNNYLYYGINFQEMIPTCMCSTMYFKDRPPRTVANALVQNNIAVQATPFNISSSIVQNNIGNGAQFPAGNGNKQNINMDFVFNYSNPSPDGRYQLKVNSPAQDAGFYAGEDCGMFDVPPGFGYVPYKLSGIPSVPSIYLLNATVSGNTLNVTVSTRSNN